VAGAVFLAGGRGGFLWTRHNCSESGSTTLTSPPTHSAAADQVLLSSALDLFDLTVADLDPALPPAVANAGNNHLILALGDRLTLSEISYDLAEGARLMRQYDLTTISLLWAETPRRFHSRNASHGGEIDIVQGEDMGARSMLKACISSAQGEGIRVSGRTRIIIR